MEIVELKMSNSIDFKSCHFKQVFQIVTLFCFQFQLILQWVLFSTIVLHLEQMRLEEEEDNENCLDVSCLSSSRNDTTAI